MDSKRILDTNSDELIRDYSKRRKDTMFDNVIHMSPNDIDDKIVTNDLININDDTEPKCNHRKEYDDDVLCSELNVSSYDSLEEMDKISLPAITQHKFKMIDNPLIIFKELKLISDSDDSDDSDNSDNSDNSDDSVDSDDSDKYEDKIIRLLYKHNELIGDFNVTTHINNMTVKISTGLCWYPYETIEKIIEIQENKKIKMIPDHFSYYIFDNTDSEDIHDIVIIEKIGCALKKVYDNYSREEQMDVCFKLKKIMTILHDNGVAHGKLSWKNIMVDSNQNIFLTDFGFTFRKNQNIFFESSKTNDLSFLNKISLL